MKYLKSPITVSFSKLFTDPNNPRISPDSRPDYETSELIFSDSIQDKLHDDIESIYDVKSLEDAITAQGWNPVDPIIVWEHHTNPGNYIVVEGNTRTTVLRNIRKKLQKEVIKLEKIHRSAKKYAKADILRQEELVQDLRQIEEDTNEIVVFPVNATTPEELMLKLPSILGVRHIKHARAWSPEATNLYMLRLYEQEFEIKYGIDEELKLENDLVKKVSKMVSEGYIKTRRNIQAAAAFSRFKVRFEERLSDGDVFSSSDQYYFENILQHKFCQDQFEFGKDDLYLSEEKAETLFQWAFKYPRGSDENILRKAEDFRLWAKIKRYDDDKATSFSRGLDVEYPDSAKPIKQLELRYLNHKEQVSPVDTVESLLNALDDVKVPVLLAQADHLKPMLEQLGKLSETYLTLIKATK
ncbi:hypothetical protein [Vibrio coralliirubri]|uniref:hypothetical protein n=1 Tax=Vibrio coralliirubri TaxID=1516159 RepID=UPI000B154BEE|nr:hypothetical protein [Vibrio coralliirubri]